MKSSADTARFRILDDFPAAHRIRIDEAGTREPVHVHHWRVDVLAESPLPVEPRAVRLRERVRERVARYRGRSLHRTPPFDRINPTAEEVARRLYDELSEAAPELDLVRVTIGEAAGFSATYHPDEFRSAPD